VRGAALARELIERLGGRTSIELGIDVDAGPGEVERWFLAATLFGNRISAAIAERAYRTLAAAGVATTADVEGRTWDELVALLDSAGYVRYDFRTASRLQTLAAVVRERHGGRIGGLAAVREPAALEAALDALPGWGPITVRLFLRELRGVWPGAIPPLDPRAARAAEHVGLVPPGEARPLAPVEALAASGDLDVRDLEAALVRLALRHGRDLERCPGGRACRLLERPPARP